ncbi:NlpC/P60 family protein [Rhodovulum steppense]|uniref:NlpC/P60 family protein n=1 Tax=Rhodovulum steppense TaxID=540251 RepID=A0A4R1YUL2_9RHOB|nr:NlpC/P60 family protein [Rhodovulum steppense]TCM84775.1 NlpC/P60 family protein [Rhodovulum steppense]
MSWWAGYVGIPFEDGGRGRCACDCWGLVRLVHAECLGVELPSYGEISARDLVRVARAIGAGQADPCWEVVDIPAAFDVVLMRARGDSRSVAHVGIAVDADRLLHTEAATGSVVVPRSHLSVAGRVMGFRRYRK